MKSGEIPGVGTKIRAQTKKFFKPFRICIFLFLSYSFGIEMINTSIHSHSSLENHTQFQTKMGKVYTFFQTKTAKKPYPAAPSSETQGQIVGEREVSARLNFPSPPKSAPGSPRMGRHIIAAHTYSSLRKRAIAWDPPPPNNPINARAPSLGPSLSLFSKVSYILTTPREPTPRFPLVKPRRHIGKREDPGNELRISRGLLRVLLWEYLWE